MPLALSYWPIHPNVCRVLFLYETPTILRSSIKIKFIKILLSGSVGLETWTFFGFLDPLIPDLRSFLQKSTRELEVFFKSSKSTPSRSSCRDRYCLINILLYTNTCVMTTHTHTCSTKKGSRSENNTHLYGRSRFTKRFLKKYQIFEKTERTKIIPLPFLYHFAKNSILSEKMPSEAESPMI